MGTLYTSAKTGDARRLYVSLRNDMAKRLEVTESGRDYAAIAKSLVSVTEIIREIDKDEQEEARKKNLIEAPTNKLAEAQKRFKVV